MSASSFADLMNHVGHEIQCATYGVNVTLNVAIECVTCGTVLLDYDNPAMQGAFVTDDDVVPICDICNKPQWSIGGDWNGETGNHISCEQALDPGGFESVYDDLPDESEPYEPPELDGWLADNVPDEDTGGETCAYVDDEQQCVRPAGHQWLHLFAYVLPGGEAFTGTPQQYAMLTGPWPEGTLTVAQIRHDKPISHFTCPGCSVPIPQVVKHFCPQDMTCWKDCTDPIGHGDPSPQLDYAAGLKQYPPCDCTACKAVLA